MSEKFVYVFGEGKAEGSREDKKILGGKGANLAEMTRLGFPVPPGFTISTDVCKFFYANKKQFPSALKAEVEKALKQLETWVGASFGGEGQPLLVSVRSGAPISMPGMMDTVLNLGLNDKTVEGLARFSKDERFSFDSYRRFIQMYSDVVLGISPHHFETILTESRRQEKVSQDSELSVTALKSTIQKFKKVVFAETAKPFPESTEEQLWGAISAVFDSWMSSRAVSYRRIHKITEDFGTAVTVQSMVFGNMGDTSATGVAFTRDPSTGERHFFGEYLLNAQGEDVVAGIRTPLLIKDLEKALPKPYAQLFELQAKLEAYFKDMQDIEFTIQQGKLYLLQTRTGKRTPYAAVRIAVDMVKENLISKKEAILRVSPQQIEQLLHPRLDPKIEKEIIAKGLPASPGAVSGEVVFSSEEAEVLSKKGKAVILVRHETSPEDITGMDAAKGILTALGGMTSHAAVVARGMGKPCVAGCGSINIDYNQQEFRVGSYIIRRGDAITIDGASGEVIKGYVATINSQVDDFFEEFMEWVDELRTLKVRANAETPQDAKVARQFGAQGIGLARTEHMFFDPTRIAAVREMILSDNKEQREKALQKIFPMQREDFYELFREMKGFPVTIRLLDPPLHEFLPRENHEMEMLASQAGVSVGEIKAKVKQLHELNPMLGHRGCRLGISFPEIYRIQVRAILEAALSLKAEMGQEVEPEIMIPFIGFLEEFLFLKKEVEEEAALVFKAKGANVKYLLGTMIEIPRAALIADQLAKHCDFFSFGTNDLTQMTLGISRDDANQFLPKYLEKGIFRIDPFQSVDMTGVGELMKIAFEKGKTNPGLKVGICGEQGGDTSTIEFCHQIGFNYVSCSPFRIPVARLAAAQATLKN